MFVERNQFVGDGVFTSLSQAVPPIDPLFVNLLVIRCKLYSKRIHAWQSMLNCDFS